MAEAHSVGDNLAEPMLVPRGVTGVGQIVVIVGNVDHLLVQEADRARMRKIYQLIGIPENITISKEKK